MQETKVFKLVLVGDKNSGKKTYINNVKHGEKCICTLQGVYFTSLLFKTNDVKNPTIIFHIWDIPEKETFSDTYNKFIRNADCAIIMFLLNGVEEKESIIWWKNNIDSINPYIPIFAVSSVLDEFYANDFSKTCGCPVISVDDKDNLLRPFERFAQISLINHYLKLSSFSDTDNFNTPVSPTINMPCSTSNQISFEKDCKEKESVSTTPIYLSQEKIQTLQSNEHEKTLQEHEKTLQEKEKTLQEKEKTLQLVQVNNLFKLILSIVNNN